MMLSKWGKRFVAGFLSTAMVFTASPLMGVVAYADEPEVSEEAYAEESSEETDDEEEIKEEVKEEVEEETEEINEEASEEEVEEDVEEADEEELLKSEEAEDEEERTEVKRLLHFSMDNTEAGLTSGDYTATVSGTNVETDKESRFMKSLAFGGGSYLTVKDKSGKSPLTGLDEITINYYSKAGTSGAGWAFFAVRNNETPDYLHSEHYLGILDKSGSLRLERYKVDNCDRPAVNETNTKSGWKMVTVVVKKDETILYVDGVKQNTVKSDALLTDILQDNSAFYIGKANWGGGEYFYGNIDEFSIYSGAMTDEQVSEKFRADEASFIVKDEDKAKLAAEEITLAKTENIKGNITLPTKNSYGAKVEWTSSRPEIISDKAVKVEGYDDMPAGVVNRTDKTEEVTLTAKISLDDKEYTKEFKVTVAPKAEEKKLTKYMFAFFPSNSEEQMYFAAGKDNLHFEDLNDGEPVLTSEIGDKGIRDPFIFRSAEGDHFYMIATDLKVQTTGWGNAQFAGSLRMLVWESDDLVNWSKPRLADVGMNTEDFEQFGNVGCLWAPEAIYDEKTGEYVVFWASMSKDKTYQITYYSKTRDFVNFTTAKKFIDRGNKQHCIDTSIVKGNDGKYYRVSADTNANEGQLSEIILESSDSVLGDWKRLANIYEIQGGMKNYDAYKKDTNVNFVGGVVEGPELFALNDGKTFGLYMDNYGGRGYIPTTTTDISDTSGKSWTLYTSNEYDFGSLKKRHGSIMGITEDEYKALIAKWGNTVNTDEEEEKAEPILTYDFEDVTGDTIADVSGNENVGKLNGNAAVVEGEDGKALYLDGNGSFAALPEGLFDGREKCTISFDMKSDTVDGNFFNLAIGKDNNKYFFLRARNTNTYLGITSASWQAESGVTAQTAAIRNNWNNYTVVFDKDKMYIYINGVLSGETKIGTKLSGLGKNLQAYLGKSFYSGDAYVKGYYDNVKVYNRALSEKEIADNCHIKLEPLKGITSKDVVFVASKIDKESKTVTCYVSKNNTKGAVKTTRLDFDLIDGARIVETEAAYDLSRDAKLKVEYDGEVIEYTLKFILSNNPLLGGQFADPDIDCFNGKYYIYPTTDGFSGWSGYQFHVFSSDNLVDWQDEGVILDLKQDADDKVVNEKGVEIAAVPWSDGSAWAPTIEEKNGKYYFYFCGNDTETNAKAIGVAYADSPTGPFTVADKPLISIKTCKDAGISMGQAIDPSVFTDKDGTSYLSFGNGNAAIVKLNDDMISIDSSTMANVSGLNGFRESLIITYRDGMYHYTWSCDDTGSENYSVAYGTSDKLGGKVNYRGMLLQKDVDKDILGTGHHSILNVPGTDDWYICYHRFMTPLGQVSGGFGYHREVCLDKLTFDKDGYMEVVHPTNEGIMDAVYVKGYEPKPEEPKPENPKPGKPSVNPGTNGGSTQPSSGTSNSSRNNATSNSTVAAGATTIADAATPLAGNTNKDAAVNPKGTKKVVNKKTANATKIEDNSDLSEDNVTSDDAVSEDTSAEEELTIEDNVKDASEDISIEDEATPTAIEEKESSSPLGIIIGVIATAFVAAIGFISIKKVKKP
ncbi:MAG: family 43 glycosylhydrolase [Pseudobutyrivibrio sp.]|nr:family 43 glycosylhydrolase [Pseudobutyrivibrio sp.]